MRRTIIIAILISINGLYGFGQRHGFLKYDLGVTFDQVQFDSNTDNFKLSEWRASSISLTYEQKINNFLSIETGVQDRFISTGVIGYVPDTFYVGAASNYLTIPLRLVLNQKIIGTFSLLQRFGTNLSIAHTFSGIDDRFTIEDYSIIVNTNLPKTYITLDLGLGLEWTFSKTKSWKLNFMYDYNISPKPILDVDLQDSNSTNYSHFESSGNYHTFMLGIGYRISNIWIKKKNTSANKK
ncbi:outer membrane protein [Bacteroidota bacterium]